MGYYNEADFRPRNCIGYILKVAQKAAHGLVHEQVRDHDLNFSQWVALVLIRDGGVDTSAGLVGHLGFNSGAVTRLVDGLEEGGFVRRDRDSADRRVVRLTLTPEGAKAARAMTPRVVDFWNEALQDFSAEEVDRLAEMLLRLTRRFETMAASAAETESKPGASA